LNLDEVGVNPTISEFSLPVISRVIHATIARRFGDHSKTLNTHT